MGSDSDLDELQGMIIDDIEHGIISHKSHSIKSFLSKSNSIKKGAISDKIQTVNRSHKKYSFVSKSKNEKYSKYATKIQMIDKQKKKKQIDDSSKMNEIKSSNSETHGLIVSKAMIESLSESESAPSGIDLSEEFIRIDDDEDNTAFDMEEFNDMYDIHKKQHNRKKSKDKYKKSKKYSSVQQMEDDEDDDVDAMDSHHRSDKVIGMQSMTEIEKTVLIKQKKESDDDESDNMSEVSNEQSLNSLTVPFSQQI